MARFKTDEEYGYNINFTKDRHLPAGHDFNITNHDDEVSALEKILNGYFDVSSIEKASELTNYKMDFGIVFLDSIIQILSKKYSIVNEYAEELDKQTSDMSHKMTIPYLSGQTISKEEKLEAYETLEKIYVQRRKIKDTLSILRVTIENFEKTRNFIVSMNRRQYSPKSKKFHGDKSFRIHSAIESSTDDDDYAISEDIE